MPEIDLTLNVSDVNFLLQVLGELPSKTGAWTLMQKIQMQAQNQPPKPADAPKPAEASAPAAPVAEAA